MHSNTTGTTKARIEAIHRFYKPGMSTKDIAAALSDLEGRTVSKNSVIGIYTRNRDHLTACPLPPSGKALASAKPKRQKTPKAKAAPKPRTIVPPKPVQGPSNVVPFLLPEKLFEYVPTHPTKRLIDLRANECRWPMNGTGFDTQFCSQEAGGSYCEHHRRLSIGEGSRGERQALKTLKRYG